MSFTEPIFLLFFSLFLLGHHLLKGNRQLLWLLIHSYSFYAWYSPSYALLLMLSTVVDFIIAKKMTDSRRKIWVITSITFNLGLLFSFKYLSFFWNGTLLPLAKLFDLDLLKWTDTIPPMGISFFTFQTMSYAIDVHRGHLRACSSLLQFACYVSLFPQLVAGPIVRAKVLIKQLQGQQSWNWSNTKEGCQQFARGFLKKNCLADPLALQLVDPTYASPLDHSPEARAIAMLAYSFQIYFDFSGYSDMAIGCGRMMGYHFPENFSHPYRSASFSEFWKRWHISLSSWLKDYLYIPLGGNRAGTFRQSTNIMITMGLGGLWHGASINFILWGALHGLFLITQNWISSIVKFKCPKTLMIPIIFTLTTLAWVPFRAQNSIDVLPFWSSLKDLSYGGLLNSAQLSLDNSILLAICCVSHFFAGFLAKTLLFHKWPTEIKAIYYGSLCYWLVVFYPNGSNTTPFIYFQF